MKSLHRRGVDTPGAKLTEAQVIEIREAYFEGPERVAMSALAEQYGVTMPTVQSLLHGATWAHVGGPTFTPDADEAE